MHVDLQITKSKSKMKVFLSKVVSVNRLSLYYHVHGNEMVGTNERNRQKRFTLGLIVLQMEDIFTSGVTSLKAYYVGFTGILVIAFCLPMCVNDDKPEPVPAAWSKYLCMQRHRLEMN